LVLKKLFNWVENKEKEDIEIKKSRELAVKRERLFSLSQSMDRFFEDFTKDFDDLFWRPWRMRLF